MSQLLLVSQLFSHGKPGATNEKWNFVELPPLSPPKTILTGSCLLFSMNLLKTTSTFPSRSFAHGTGAEIIFYLSLKLEKSHFKHSFSLREDEKQMY